MPLPGNNPNLSPAALPAAPQASRNRERRSLAALWQQLPAKADRQGNLFDVSLGTFERCGESFELRKVTFIGPCAGGTPWLRLGIFAGLHGDEPSGVHALIALIAELQDAPELARGLEIHFYPVCNPSGYVDKTRWLRGGPDMNREFWQNSSAPEVRILEKEISGLHFDGLISLHSDDSSDGIYGYVAGDVLTRYLLEPALQAASAHIPRNTSGVIDGWRADGAIIEEGFAGVLSAPPQRQMRPFEIVFETPEAAPEFRQIAAHRAALLAIFDASIEIRSHAADI